RRHTRFSRDWSSDVCSSDLLNAGDAISTTQTIYVYGETGTTPNCTDENNFVVTINNTPAIDAPADICACDSYTLPALTGGAYYRSEERRVGKECRICW